MQLYWIKYRLKQKDFLVYCKPVIQNMVDYFTKYHPPHHHREILADYLYISNVLLKINHKVLQEWKIPYSRQTILLYSRQTIQLFKSVLMAYVRTDTQNPQLQRISYDGGGHMEVYLIICNKYGKSKINPQTN